MNFLTKLFFAMTCILFLGLIYISSSNRIGFYTQMTQAETRKIVDQNKKIGKLNDSIAAILAIQASSRRMIKIQDENEPFSSYPSEMSMQLASNKQKVQ